MEHDFINGNLKFLHMKNVHEAEAYPEPFQTPFQDRVFCQKKLKLITIFTKSSFLDILQGSEIASVNDFIFQLVFRLELLLLQFLKILTIFSYLLFRQYFPKTFSGHLHLLLVFNFIMAYS